MTHYTICCGYASHYRNTVTLEADTLDEALEKAIEQAGDDPHWKSADYCGPSSRRDRTKTTPPRHDRILTYERRQTCAGV